ncbi:DNA-binding LacI/PurR family transcriptional regulator [Thermocatellispora tengchongensis]|uniref:DNA-binding LacI/PurR family transcriptional regulator n=1 Tax=Thermocatellispora tengchongensis TaxID=1073253 RepID=A0A840P8C4_9ACTN|nr:LacI family DNA-binding transcriptional regulator [Thermocatellispora tengchongensis]MBB5135542.1 DNA-binding LacI/PurR family transcriptional regulator [Thermocatellispora tengchongensis]
MTRPAKRTTIADVARAAGVSPATVSFVLNDTPGQSIPEETRSRVLEAVRRLDYRPRGSARSLAAGRSDVVLLSIPHLSIGPGITRFVEQFAASLADAGLTLVTHLAGAPGRPLPDVCAAVDASVVAGLDPFDEDTARGLRRAGADVVFTTDVEARPTLRGMGRLQAEHLIALGHRRLGYAMPEHPLLRKIADERLLGVADACAQAGIDPPLALDTKLDLTAMARAARRWRRESVTAVCAYNDEVAIALLAGMRHARMTAPGDLAVMGADDIPLARLTDPPLSTVAFDLEKVGRSLAEAVVATLSGGKPRVSPASLSPHVIHRAST